MGRVCLLDDGKICTKCLEEEACEGMDKNECKNCPRWLKSSSFEFKEGKQGETNKELIEQT